MSAIRDNWRFALLVIAVTISLFLLFSPTMAPDGARSEGPTNLKYGLELSGGTSIRAPLAGWTAEGIEYDGNNETAVETAVADRIDGVSARNVELMSPRATGDEDRSDSFHSAERSA